MTPRFNRSADETHASICAPRCTKSGGIIPHEKCTNDVPAGVTAHPYCGFTDYDTDYKYCALSCRVDPKHKMLCAKGATCFEFSVPPDPPISNTSTTEGICGYKHTHTEN
jgi:hypothetical protein